MLAYLFLAFLALGAAAISSARAYNRYSAARVARLRLRGREFYAAADRLLANPALDEKHLEMLRFLADSVAREKDALIWSASMIEVRRKMRHSGNSAEPSPPELLNDAHDMTQAALLFIAELQPVLGHPLREFASFDLKAKRSFSSRLSAAFVISCYKVAEHFYLSTAVISAVVLLSLFVEASSYKVFVEYAICFSTGMGISVVNIWLNSRSALHDDSTSRTSVTGALASALAPSGPRFQRPTHAAV